VTAAQLAALLADFYREKAGLRDRHVAGARAISGYDFNNAYQNIIAREDAQVGWVRAALEDLGVPVPDVPATALPAGTGRALEGAIVDDDLRTAREFLARWRRRLPEMTNARHRRMLEVILGETVEHERFLSQMLEGRSDLLGRRHANEGTGGGVLPTRWVE
jgi:hypothetical protein